MDDSSVNNNLKHAKALGSRAWNVSLDEMLEEDRDASIADPMEAPWESGDPLKERLYEAVQELPEDQQELFAMRYLWEMTQQEISDRTGIESMIGKDWERMRWNPSSGQRAVLIRMISSAAGRSAQDELFASLMETFVADCERTYTSDVPAVMMYCEVRHLGGKAAADRIFRRCKGDYSLNAILAALKMDDPGSNQVGASVFMSRHLKCIEFIRKYAVEEKGGSSKGSAGSGNSKGNESGRNSKGSAGSGSSESGRNSKSSESGGNSKGSTGSGSSKSGGSSKGSTGSGSSKGSESGKEDTMATALSRAKILLRQPKNDVMTGYTPDGKQCFVDAGAWVKKPKRGDVIYFYSTAKGRIGHVGIVERVDAGAKMVYTVEGNTSSSEYAENGGCVARHCYSYAQMGGKNRVNGFGRPDFAGAGVTADQFVKMAVSFLGYLEKKSNAELNSKTANAGSNNYQRFQRDIGAGNGDQWCQFFVDAVALYTCEGSDGKDGGAAGSSGSGKIGGSSGSKAGGSGKAGGSTGSGGSGKAGGSSGNGGSGGSGKNGGNSGSKTGVSGSKSSSGSGRRVLKEDVVWTGRVTASSLNVRVWAGTENTVVSFSPLKKGTEIGVCDEMTDLDYEKWYYIEFEGRHGFVCGKYVERV